MFKKKLKVKVVHLEDSEYIIKFSIYRFIPIYSIFKRFWIIQVWGSWISDVGNSKEMEAVAEVLTIENIENHYRTEKKRESGFIARKKSDKKKQVPYKTKRIK